MTIAMNVTSRCSRAGAEALRQGAQLAADARDTFRAGALLLRGSPSAVGWVAGWLSTEFPPHVVTGHALSRSSRPSIGRVGTTWAAQRADQALTAALQGSFGPDYRDLVSHPTAVQPACAPRSGRLRRQGSHQRYAGETSDISYGPHGRDNLLDIWRRHDLAPGSRAPVLIQVPGGAWAVGDQRVQGYTLMSHMVELGWICVSINYSKSPRSAFPSHLVDVKRAIAWVRENIADYGGDPDFLAITGGSAGGHLASLAALTPNDPTFQPGFEDADTTVQAAAPYYGVYDFTDVDNMHELMLPFLEQFVMKARYTDAARALQGGFADFLRAQGCSAVLCAARRERRSGSQRPGAGLHRGVAGRRSRFGVLRRTRQCAPRFRHHPDGPVTSGSESGRGLPWNHLRPARRVATGLRAAVGQSG